MLGILLALLSNFIVGSLELGEVEWRWMLGVVIVAPRLVLCGRRRRGRVESEEVLRLLQESGVSRWWEVKASGGAPPLQWTRERSNFREWR